jgi:hypothetical protein
MKQNWNSITGLGAPQMGGCLRAGLGRGISRLKWIIVDVICMADLAFSHPELARRWDLLVKAAWSHSWDVRITSSSRSYQTQLAWYRLDQAGLWPTGPVANPDQIWGMTPWGWLAKGSLHMVQQDGYSHALDLSFVGATASQFRAIALPCGLRFPEAGEDWHCQFWGNDGIYPVTEDDMTLEEFMHGIGTVGEAQGNLKMIDGVIHQKLSDGNWYTLADVQEFIHRHMKHLDEG